MKKLTTMSLRIDPAGTLFSSLIPDRVVWQAFNWLVGGSPSCSPRFNLELCLRDWIALNYPTVRWSLDAIIKEGDDKFGQYVGVDGNEELLLND